MSSAKSNVIEEIVCWGISLKHMWPGQRKGPTWHKIHLITTANSKYLEFCVQYLLSVSCNMFPIQLSIDRENFTSMASADN